MLSENTILTKGVVVLQKRLPSSWTAELVGSALHESQGRVDGLVRVRAPDGREAVLVAEVKQRLDPRRAQSVADRAELRASALPVLAIAPWMSSSTQEILASRGVHCLDLTGNAQLTLAEPGLCIHTMGADRDPWPEASRVTLRGAKAARVVRALCAMRPPLGVRALAAKANTTPGYVSKLLGMLDEQAAVQRTGSGQVGGVDLKRLLERWAEDAPLSARATASTWIAPRGLTDLQARLRTARLRYAVTGSLAASRRAPVAASRLASIYVDDPDTFATAVDLRPTDAGANVLLLVPDDAYPFEDLWADNGVQFAALPQIVADLLTGPGRGPAEADALLAWMSEHAEVELG